MHRCPYCGESTAVQSLTAEDGLSAIDAWQKQAEASQLNDEGGRLFIEGRYEEAAAVFQKAIESNPMNAVAYGNLGHAYTRMGQLEKALPLLERCIQIDPRTEGADRALWQLRSALRTDRFQGPEGLCMAWCPHCKRLFLSRGGDVVEEWLAAAKDRPEICERHHAVEVDLSQAAPHLGVPRQDLLAQLRERLEHFTRGSFRTDAENLPLFRAFWRWVVEHLGVFFYDVDEPPFIP